MSYDSLWKYQYWYRGYDFDLVLYYNGINDARANNYPRGVFRDDYTQFPATAASPRSSSGSMLTRCSRAPSG